MGFSGHRHTLANLCPGKTQYPLYWRLSGPQGQSGETLKISPPPGFNPRTVQPIASCYTDHAIPAFNDVRSAHKILVELPEGNRPLQRSGFQLEDAVKSYVWEVEYDIVACVGILLLNKQFCTKP